MNAETIAFIGGGQMVRSLVGGLLAGGRSATTVRVSEPVHALRDALHRQFGVQVFADNTEGVATAGTWVLGVKPQAARVVCEQLAPTAQRERPLVVSIAAGVTTAQLDHWLGGDMAIVRAMPNTPALIGAGITALYANPGVDAGGCHRTERLLAATGDTVWLTDEAKMDVVTAVSGSGPAYVFLLAEAMLSAASTEGLPADAARTLVLQTLLGAARLMIEDNATPAELRVRVTSPGGTTEAAIASMLRDDVPHAIMRAIHAAAERSRALSAANQ